VELASLEAMLVRVETVFPRYTPRSVTMLLPLVSTLAMPLAGAVQTYQTEARRCYRVMRLALSTVAFSLVPVTLTEMPLIASALAKLSLVGRQRRCAPCNGTAGMVVGDDGVVGVCSRVQAAAADRQIPMP